MYGGFFIAHKLDLNQLTILFSSFSPYKLLVFIKYDNVKLWSHVIIPMRQLDFDFISLGAGFLKPEQNTGKIDGYNLQNQ